jgi:hypothetical protein
MSAFKYAWKFRQQRFMHSAVELGIFLVYNNICVVSREDLFIKAYSVEGIYYTVVDVFYRF